MNRRSTMRLVTLTAATGLALASLTACSSGDGGGGEGGGDGEVTITWWHNGTTGPLPQVWEEVAQEFEADHPGVNVEQTGYQNEELQRTLIPNALAAGDPPDLFEVWPGGELRDQVENGYLMPLDDEIPDTIESVGAAVNPGRSTARPTPSRSPSASRASGTTPTCSSRRASTRRRRRSTSSSTSSSS